jgi:oxygen-dependent protoporphyrinogen oxidase
VVGQSDAELKGIACDELRRVHGIAGEPLFVRVTRWPMALPQYTIGHEARVARIFEAAAARPGLFMAGASYKGVGIPDCIASAWQAADAAITYSRAT